MSIEELMKSYARVAVHVGLNLQPGQPLIVIGSGLSGGVSFDAAPFIRMVAEVAYKAGASLVDVLWGDDDLLLSRLQLAPQQSFLEPSTWRSDALCALARTGHAVLNVRVVTPALFRSQAHERLAALLKAVRRDAGPVNDLLTRHETNWCVIACPTMAWAERVFSDTTGSTALLRLWNTVGAACRLTAEDPIERWKAHVTALSAKCEYLTERRYVQLRYYGGDTDLVVGLPSGHRWRTATMTSRTGIVFTNNLPSEEVLTLPHRDQVDGVIRTSRPASSGGVILRDVLLTFRQGRLVDVDAASGADTIRQFSALDEGGSRLGEVALVPHDSVWAEPGVVYYDTLFDENASSHIALGSAFRHTLGGGQAMSDESFRQAGGNTSAGHLDLPIGSELLNVDGVRSNGTVEPIMRGGVWSMTPSAGGPAS